MLNSYDANAYATKMYGCSFSGIIKNIIIELQSKNYTLEQISETIGVDVRTINNWKQGHFSMPRKKNLDQFCKFLESIGMYSASNNIKVQSRNNERIAQKLKEYESYTYHLPTEDVISEIPTYIFSSDDLEDILEVFDSPDWPEVCNFIYACVNYGSKENAIRYLFPGKDCFTEAQDIARINAKLESLQTAGISLDFWAATLFKFHGIPRSLLDFSPQVFEIFIDEYLKNKTGEATFTFVFLKNLLETVDTKETLDLIQILITSESTFDPRGRFVRYLFDRLIEFCDHVLTQDGVALLEWAKTNNL